MNVESDEILNAQDVSTLLKIGLSATYHLLQSGAIRARQIGASKGSRGTWRVLKSEVFSFLRGHNEPANLPEPTNQENES